MSALRRHEMKRIGQLIEAITARDNLLGACCEARQAAPRILPTNRRRRLLSWALSSGLSERMASFL